MKRKSLLLRNTLKKIKINKKKLAAFTIFISLLFSVFFNFLYFNLSADKTNEIRSNKNNDYNLKINTNSYFTNSEDTILRTIKNIKGIRFSKKIKAKANFDDKKIDISIKSINSNRNTKSKNYINRLNIISGRYPKTINEGLIDERLEKKYNLEIGDLITLELDNNDDLKAKKIKIVGSVNENILEKGYFIYLEEKDFSNKNYNEVLLTFNDTTNISKYKKNINDLITPLLTDKLNTQKGYIENSIKDYNAELNNLYNLELPQDYLNQTIEKYTNKIKVLENEKNNINELKIDYKNGISNKEFNNKNFKIISIVIICILFITYLIYIYYLFKKKKNKILTLISYRFNKLNIINYYLLNYIICVLFGFILSIIFYHLITSVLILINFKTLKMIIYFDFGKFILYYLLFIIILYLITTLITLCTFYKSKYLKKLKLPKFVKKCKLK